MPECEYNLYHCATALAKAPKSRETTNAMYAAKAAAREIPTLPVPLHLRNAPTKLMKDLGYTKGYKWEAGHKPCGRLLPDALSGTDFTAKD
jgi:putative ATPase